MTRQKSSKKKNCCARRPHRKNVVLIYTTSVKSSDELQKTLFHFFKFDFQWCETEFCFKITSYFKIYLKFGNILEIWLPVRSRFGNALEIFFGNIFGNIFWKCCRCAIGQTTHALKIFSIFSTMHFFQRIFCSRSYIMFKKKSRAQFKFDVQ